ncbi:hypothetical protein J4217_03735 [Candidatus Pacearchaeota archaeon]|nr:hypothetical protein [uncultured archaeon]AQS33249.1 hypothetical protein [uncultured archaeon]MBS3091530.1 hypothetical protein [Candidatus Pacearchaeota archaeon]
MQELTNIIEKLRKEGYFICDFAYEEFSDSRLQFDHGVMPNPDKAHGHRSLARMINEHLKNGIHLTPILIHIFLGSRKMKLPEQMNGKTNDNDRFDYPIEVDVSTRTMNPYLEYRKLQNPEKIYEDITRIFQESGWNANKA